jgi:hypothetical protein
MTLRLLGILGTVFLGMPAALLTAGWLGTVLPVIAGAIIGGLLVGAVATAAILQTLPYC